MRTRLDIFNFWEAIHEGKLTCMVVNFSRSAFVAHPSTEMYIRKRAKHILSDQVTAHCGYRMKPKRATNQKNVSSRVDTGSNGPKSSSQNSKKLENQSARSSISASASSSNKSFAYTCSGCNKPIKRDKYLLKACDNYWHEDCLRCDRCHGRLGELGSTLYTKSSMNLCRKDYLEMFGETGVCSVCEKLICATEMVMKAKQNVYHLECFACQMCNERFCVGDRFYLCENKVICRYDYEEHILPIQKSMNAQSAANAWQHTPHVNLLKDLPLDLFNIQQQNQQIQTRPIEELRLDDQQRLNQSFHSLIPAQVNNNTTRFILLEDLNSLKKSNEESTISSVALDKKNSSEQSLCESSSSYSEASCLLEAQSKHADLINSGHNDDANNEVDDNDIKQARDDKEVGLKGQNSNTSFNQLRLERD